MPDRKEMKDEKGMRDNGDFSPMRLDYATRAIQKYMDTTEAMDGAAETLRGPRTPGGSPYIPDSPEEGIPSMGESPTEVTAGAAEMLQQRPKSEHRRFAESKETRYDKVARQPGDPFEYAMKGDRIFVRKKGEEEFRDVTGIANDSQIRAVINEHGKAQEKKDERPHTFKRSGGEPMSAQERTGVEDRPPVTTEDFEKALEEKSEPAPEDIRLLRQLVRGSR